MTDKPSPQDEEIIRRLRNLKNAGADYPADSLQRRRASFRAASRGLRLVGPVSSGFLKGRLHFLAHISAKALEVILVSVLLVEAGLSAYLFRDPIRNWLTPGTTTPTATLSTRTLQPGLTGTATATLTPTPTGTLTPTPTGIFILATPTQKILPTDEGFHYGQTRTPNP